MRNLTLLTDLYQLTMGQGYFNEGKHEQRAVFDVFFRPNRMITYSVAAGMEQAADYLENLHFDESALDALSLAAYVANETNEDIGARRLHTIFEQLLEDISFNAGGDMPDVDVNINGDYVREHLGEAARAQDLKRYIL